MCNQYNNSLIEKAANDIYIYYSEEIHSVTHTYEKALFSIQSKLRVLCLSYKYN